MDKIINAEIITIGDEILFGHIIDTNTQWLGLELTAIGIRPKKKTSVADVKSDITDALSLAHQRADLIVITGGLGPTKDDVTKEALCEYFETNLQVHPEALRFVTAFFEKRGRPMIESNIKQAWLPEKADYIENRWGTAPAMWFEKEGRVYISLPGVPFEMKNLMKNVVLEKIKTYFSPQVIIHKAIRTVGIGESFLAERIASWEDSLPSNVKLAYLPSLSGVKIRLTATGASSNELELLLDRQIKDVFPTIREFVYGFDDDELEEVLGQFLTDEEESIAVAESCTGGNVAARFTRFPGSASYFLGGVVSYSNEMKMNVLKVKSETLESFGAVSEQTAIEMAEGVRKLAGSTYGLSTTGIAGPGGGTPEKPVGTVWIACASPESTVTLKLNLGGDRKQNIEMTTVHVMNLLRKTMNNRSNKTVLA